MHSGNDVCCGGFQCPPLTVFPRTYSHYVETKKYFSNEINITSHSDSSLQWIFGLFQYNERNYQTPGDLYEPGQTQLATPFNLTVTALAAPNPSDAIYLQQQEMHDNSYAAFAQTDWNFTPTWKLTTGLRYTYDILKGGEQLRELCFGIAGLSWRLSPSQRHGSRACSAHLRRSTTSPRPTRPSPVALQLPAIHLPPAPSIRASEGFPICCPTASGRGLGRQLDCAHRDSRG